MKSKSPIIRRFIDEVLSQGNIESTGKYFHEDVVEQVPLPGQGPGLDGLMNVLRVFRVAFPDMLWTVQEQIEEGEKVVTRFEWTGTHEGEIFGVPATGRSVTVWGIVIDRFVGDKVKETRIIMDTLGLMAQLGVFPPPTS
ncbi:MAG: ester cyclase [Luteolibacter sp.]